MALKSQLDNDIKAALLGGDRFVAAVLRDFKAVILNEEVAQKKRDEGLADADIEKLIAREVKKRHESAALYDEAGRSELAETERAELEVLQKYLPEQLSEADIQAIIDDVISGMDNPTPAQMGLIIGSVKAKAGNAADGAVIARLVKEALN